MAKQIYVDENGNPIEVSGTINTAELLPISGNDPTDTKSYIDNRKYTTDEQQTVYRVPMTKYAEISGRGYGMALVFANYEIFAVRFADINYYATRLTNNGALSLSVAYDSGDMVLTFSGTVWGGITVIA